MLSHFIILIIVSLNFLENTFTVGLTLENIYYRHTFMSGITYFTKFSQWRAHATTSIFDILQSFHTQTIIMAMHFNVENIRPVSILAHQSATQNSLLGEKNNIKEPCSKYLRGFQPNKSKHTPLQGETTQIGCKHCWCVSQNISPQKNFFYWPMI